MLFAPSPWFGTVEVTPGAYFVRIRGKPGMHLNRDHNRISNRSSRVDWVSDPQPNACYKGLASTLRMRHEWLVMPGAAANDNLTPDIASVMQLALRVCVPPTSESAAIGVETEKPSEAIFDSQ